MTLMMRRLTLLFGWLLAAVALAQPERIESFHSDIVIQPDGGMYVSETIAVTAAGEQIRRGIYRDFPTRYTDALGNRYRVDFDIEGVLRDGAPEPFHTQLQGNGVRVYIGDKDRLLQPGRYEYNLRYHTDRQLGFFAGHDELYWNVTGNGWDFTIQRASARVRLPPGVDIAAAELSAYTGFQGERGADYQARLDGGGYVSFETTRPLAPREGLTIVVTWPKGFVAEPTAADRAGYLLHDNAHLLLALAGMAVLLVFYGWAWHRFGRDPEPGVIMTRYYPPAGFSPASVRYVQHMGYDRTCFAAAVINLAVKGFLTMAEHGGDYTLRKTGKAVELAAGEKALATALFGSGAEIELKQANHRRIKRALDAHEAALAVDYDRKYFLTNTRWFVVGLLLTVIALALVLVAWAGIEGMSGDLFLLVWLTPWTFVCLALAARVASSLRSRHWGQAIRHGVVAVPFLFFEVLVTWQFAQQVPVLLLVFLLALVLVNWVFYELLKAPTAAGRKLLDEVEGFQRYLELAERDELAFKHPLGKTPQLFEQYLPYALALGVEQAWAEAFAGEIAGAVAGTEKPAWSPGWYSGRRWDSADLSGFSRSLGSSFVGSIAASSTAPGSSSGSGGGGSSGGGGGGGGGGGW